jgi:hypothetical protein
MDVDGIVQDIWQLQELVQKGFLRARWLIRSPGGFIIGEVYDIKSLPDIAVDENDEKFNVNFDCVEVVYSVNKEYHK